MVGLALAFALGIGLGLQATVPSNLAWSLAAFLVGVGILSALLPGRPNRTEGWSGSVLRRAGTAALLGATVVVGYLNAALRAPRVPLLGEVVAAADTPAEVVGMIAEEPEPTGFHGRHRSLRFPLSVSALRVPPEGLFRPVAGTVFVRYWLGPVPSPAHAEKWCFRGRLTQRLREDGHPGQIASLATDWRTARCVQRAGPLLRWSSALRTATLQRLTRGIRDRPEAVEVLKSLLLGYRGHMPRALHQTFAHTGTLHIFAISGTHVAVFVGIMVAALSACGVGRRYWVLLLAPMLFIYTLLTGVQPSATRAAIMAALYWMAPLLHRQPDVYSALALAAIVILAAAPAQLHDAGLIMSFTVVVGLILLFPVLIRPWQVACMPDPWQLQPERVWRRWLGRAGLSFGNLVALSTAAWLVSVPLTAVFFRTIAPIGLVGNLVAVPLAWIIIVTGAVSLLAGSLIMALGTLLNQINAVWALILVRVMSLLAAVPGGHVAVDPPPPWWIAAFYGMLGLWCLKFGVDTARRPRL